MENVPKSVIAYQRILKRLVQKDPLTVVRFGDGEHCILAGKATNRWRSPGFEHRVPCGWAYDPKRHEALRERLLETVRFQHPNWVCCGYASINRFAGYNVSETHGAVWIQNIEDVYTNWPKLFCDRGCVLVSHEKSVVTRFPFAVARHFKIPANYWERQDLIEEQVTFAKQSPGLLWFVLGGPGAKILCFELFKADPTGTHLDMGSAFDPWLGLGLTRCSLRDTPFMVKWRAEVQGQQL